MARPCKTLFAHYAWINIELHKVNAIPTEHRVVGAIVDACGYSTMFVCKCTMALTIPFVHRNDRHGDRGVEENSVLVMSVLCLKIHAKFTIIAKFLSCGRVIFPCGLWFLQFGPGEDLFVTGTA